MARSDEDPYAGIASAIIETPPSLPKKSTESVDPYSGIAQEDAGDGYAANATREALQGLTFGAGDELEAGLRTGFGFLGDYGKTVDDIRQQGKQFRKANPIVALGLNLAGGVPLMFVPGLGAAKMAQAATYGRAGLEGLKTGAKWGAAYGVGAADPRAGSSLGEAASARLGGGVMGGAIGAPLGAGLGVAGQWAGNRIPQIREQIRAWRDPELRGVDDVARDMNAAGLSAQDFMTQASPKIQGRSNVTQEQVSDFVKMHELGASTKEIAAKHNVAPSIVNDWVKKYKDEVLPGLSNTNLVERARILRTPDSGEYQQLIPGELDELLKTSARGTGEGREIAGKRLMERQLQQGDRLDSTVRQFFGGKELKATAKTKTSLARDFDDYVSKTISDRQQQANAYYKKLDADTTPIMGFDEVENFMTDPLFSQVLNDALVSAQRSGVWEQQGQALSPKAVNFIQKRLRATADAAWKRGDPSAEDLSLLHRQFLDQVADRYPGFKELRNWYSHRLSREEALDVGRKFNFDGDSPAATRAMEFYRSWSSGKPTRPDFSAAARATPAQRQAVLDDFKRAFGRAIIADVRNKRATNSLAMPFDKPVARENVLEVLGEKQGKAFLAAMRKEREGTDTFQRTFGNSHTADLLQRFERDKEVLDVGAQVASGNFLGAFGNLYKMGSRKAAEQAAGRKANILTETDPAKLRGYLDEIARSQQWRDFNRGAFAQPTGYVAGPASGAFTRRALDEGKE